MASRMMISAHSTAGKNSMVASSHVVQMSSIAPVTMRRSSRYIVAGSVSYIGNTMPLSYRTSQRAILAGSSSSSRKGAVMTKAEISYVMIKPDGMFLVSHSLAPSLFKNGFLSSFPTE